MPVHVNTSTYKNTIDGTPLSWLLANVGDEVTITHDISVYEYAISSTDSPWIFNNNDGYLGSVWITGGDFSKFNVGDNITIYEYATSTLQFTGSILEKLSNTEVRIASTGVYVTNTLGTKNVMSKVASVTALFYKWNLVENNEATNFYSKIDGSEQVASCAVNANDLITQRPMIFIGQLPYQIGTITIVGLGTSSNPIYKSNFLITHKTRITPIMLAAQWDDILNSISPDYFANFNCLRPVFYFEARYFLTDPNNIQTELIDTVLGNTGWFNENWNTGLTKYSRSGLAYTDSFAASIPGVLLKVSNATSFTFDIDNTLDSPFVAGLTKLELSFAKAPNDEIEYTNNQRNLRHNFVWETVTLTVQTTPTGVNGDNYSDPTIRSLEGVKATIINASKIRVTGKINMLQPAIDIFNESDEPRYMMFASVQNRAVLGALADRVTILVDAGAVYFQTDFPSLVQMIDARLLPHTNAGYFDPILRGNKFTEDELVALAPFRIVEDVNHPTTTKVITRITGKLIIINISTGVKFNLEVTNINVANTPVINGAQVFNILQAKPIHVPSTEIRKNINVWYDIATSTYYMAYPFLNRWEYWVALQGVDQFFYNQAQQNNGQNQDWQHYISGNWILAFELEVAMKINGVPAIYNNIITFDDMDRNLALPTSLVIDTFDVNTLTPLSNAGTKYILGYDYTLMRATFTNLTALFVANKCTVVLGIEVFEEGGVNGKRRMSSKYVSDSDTWFIPLPTETKTKLTVTSTTVIGEAWIDFNQINLTKGKYKLSARFYYDNGSAPNPIHDYFGDQNVILIKNNPIPSNPIVIPPTVTDCDSDFIWRVLADASGSTSLKNDKNSFLWWFDKDAVSTAVIYLILPDGTSLNLTANSTLGAAYDYGFYVNGQGEKLVGYLINWKAVMAIYGECIYQVKCVATTIFGATQTLFSDKYCLKQYTTSRADGTVRIEYNLNGILGINDMDTRSKDLGTLNWYNQHRFDGIFYYNNSQYTVDEIQYENGQRLTVEDEQAPEFLLKLKSMAYFKHDVMRTDILQADKILITDYNSKNVTSFYQKDVRKSADYSPGWKIGRSKIAPIEIKFKQTFNNLRKFIS